MKIIIWSVLIWTLAVYVGLVAAFGFAGPVALGLHFLRVMITVAVLVFYVPALTHMFSEIPLPRRDYLLAGIILMVLSAVSFSIWNEAGRVFEVNTSVFASPIAGLFSLFLVMGAAFHLIAPDASGPRPRIIAVIIGVIASVALVFVAPLFR